MKYAYIMGDGFCNIVDTTTGESFAVNYNHPSYSDIVAMVQRGDYESAINLIDIKPKIQECIGAISVSKEKYPKVELDGSRVNVIWGPGHKEELNNTLTHRIVELARRNLPITSLVNFLSNLVQNPSKTSINELYSFMESGKLPLTEDGHFIAYKRIRSDYKDIYSGTMDNSPGMVLEVPRGSVDDNRDNTCSTGLHFCSFDYLQSFGSKESGSDRVVLVKINPRDVVSIPSDYNNTKGRTCRYEVISEYTGKWKSGEDTLKSAPVYDDVYALDERADIIRNSTAVADAWDQAPMQQYTNTTVGNYMWDPIMRRWRDVQTGQVVSKFTVAAQNGVSVVGLELKQN